MFHNDGTSQITPPYLNSFWFSFQMFLVSLQQLFKKFNVIDDVIIVGYLSTSLTIFILNIYFILNCTLSYFKSLNKTFNFLFSLNFLKTLPCWYAKDIMFLLFVLIISSYSFIIFTAFSSLPLSACSFKSSVLMFAL